jgi:hypothetical protein
MPAVITRAAVFFRLAAKRADWTGDEAKLVVARAMRRQDRRRRRR